LNTIVIGENAARPDIYKRVKFISQYGSGNHPIINSACAISGTYIAILLDDNPTVNGMNRAGLYSFHNSGANVACVDGSIRFLEASTDGAALHAMATRAGNEVTGRHGF
jgi:hypothetical protein